MFASWSYRQSEGLAERCFVVEKKSNRATSGRSLTSVMIALLLAVQQSGAHEKMLSTVSRIRAHLGTLRPQDAQQVTTK